MWVAVFTEVKSYGQPATLISTPTSFGAARAAVLAALKAEKDDVKLTACENHAWRSKSIRDVLPADMEKAFPAAERHVEEHFNVAVFKKGLLNRTFFLIPQHSYMWDNVKRLWSPEEEDEEEDDDDYRGYESEDHYRSDEEPAWQRNCTCDAIGPYFCSCRRDDDDY